MTTLELREERFESRVEATIAVALVIVLQCALAAVSLHHGWELLGVPGWVWFIPVPFELVLLGALAAVWRRDDADQLGRRRMLALTLVWVIAGVNLVALVLLIGALVNAEQKTGGELLFEGVAIWSTNVVAFGLLFWEIDRGGPVRRLRPVAPPPDFQFPQLENPSLAAPGWRPGLVDYVYVSFTNAIAFSPTDAMPLSRRAKALMLVESTVSAVTVLLVAARAVNVLS